MIARKRNRCHSEPSFAFSLDRRRRVWRPTSVETVSNQVVTTILETVSQCVFSAALAFCTMVHSFPQGDFEISLANKNREVYVSDRLSREA